MPQLQGPGGCYLISPTAWSGFGQPPYTVGCLRMFTDQPSRTAGGCNMRSAPRGWCLLGPVSTFLEVFSSVVHEAVLFVTVRWMCWPINSYVLMSGAGVISAWDNLPPLRSTIFGKEGGGGGGVDRPSLLVKNAGLVSPASLATQTISAATASASDSPLATAVNDVYPGQNESTRASVLVGGA